MERTHRWARARWRARGDSPQALFAIVQGACFEDLRRESAGVLDRRSTASTASRSAGSPSARARAQREDITELTAAAAARGPAALPDGRRHAARPARGGASRRRHVRLHPADRVGAAGRRVHVARPDRPARAACTGSPSSRSMPRATATRARATRARTCITSSSARSRSAGSCSRPTTSRFYLRLMREIRAHIARDTFARVPRRAARRRSRSPISTTRRAPPPREAGKPTDARRVRACTVAATASRASSTSPSGEIMHSVNHPDVEAERVYVAQSRHDRARRSPRATRRSSCGTSGSAPRTTRWRSSARSMRAPGARDRRARQLRARPRRASARARAHRALRAPAPSRAAHPRAARPRSSATGFTWRLREGDFLDARSPTRRRPT